MCYSEKLNKDSNILIKGASGDRESHQKLNFFFVDFSPLNWLAVKRFSVVEMPKSENIFCCDKIAFQQARKFFWAYIWLQPDKRPPDRPIRVKKKELFFCSTYFIWDGSLERNFSSWETNTNTIRACLYRPWWKRLGLVFNISCTTNQF